MINNLTTQLVIKNELTKQLIRSLIFKLPSPHLESHVD